MSRMTEVEQKAWDELVERSREAMELRKTEGLEFGNVADDRAILAAHREIVALRKVLEKHRRFHGKVACGGHPECYVCEAEEALLNAAKGE